MRDQWEYWPKVDVYITASDHVIKGKQQTLEALQVLSQASITAENWKLFAAQLEILDVPGKQEIVADWKKRFAMLPGGTVGGAAGPGIMTGDPITSGLPSLPGGVPTGL